MKYSQKEMIEKLKENNFYFKKKFGQNFIIDSNIINKIVDNSDIENNTLVIERLELAFGKENVKIK